MISHNNRRYSISSEKYFIFIVTILFLFLTFFVLKDILTLIIFSFILSYFLYPVYKFFLTKINDKRLSAISTLFSASFFIFIPIIFMVYFISLNLLKLILKYKEYIENPELLNTVFSNLLLTITDSKMLININYSDFFQNIFIYIIDMSTQILYAIPILFAYFLIILFISYYILIYNKEMLVALNEYLPLTLKKQNEILTNITKNLKVLFRGYFLTGLIQTLVAVFAYVIFGAPNILILAFLTFVTSIIPYIGTPFVWLPVGIYMILNGNTFGGYGLLIFGTFVISLVDNFLRPILMSDEDTISPPLVFVGLIGGLFAFGIPGIILGPIIISITAIMLRYLKEFYELRYE